MRIAYIGEKPIKTDNVANSGAVWHGKGDIQEVPDALAGKLLVHQGVWAKVDAEKVDDTTATEGRTTIKLPDGTTKDLSGLDKAALHALADELGVKVHHAAGAAKVAEALLAAFPG